MTYNPHVHNRQSTRLRGHDYRAFGPYFVTICSYSKEPLFGGVDRGNLELNPFGHVVSREWLRTGEVRSYARMDEYVVMPNHFHGIVWLERDVGAQRAAPLRRDIALLPNVQPGSLGAVLRAFKSASTKRINELRHAVGTPVWQRNYHERILRNEDELERARQYIRDNPTKWPEDPNFTSHSLSVELPMRARPAPRT